MRTDGAGSSTGEERAVRFVRRPTAGAIMVTKTIGASDEGGEEIPARTGRNIVILSDGTGQRGGILVDERRSNIYKMFRATRCGPDSPVDPALQVAFYDPGLGTLPGGIYSPAALARILYNVASQANGMGITRNIIDCYAALVRL